MKTGLVMILALAMSLPITSAKAHGSGEHVMGMVTAIDTSQIEVKPPKGEPVTVLLNDKTRYLSKGGAQPRPQVGDRVFIDVAKDGASLRAEEVQFATPAKSDQ